MTRARTYRSHSEYAIIAANMQPLAVSRGERAVLVLAGAHADVALMSANGYSGTTSSGAGSTLGYSTSTVKGFMGKLVRRGLLEWSLLRSADGSRMVRIPQSIMDEVSTGVVAP